jgi:ABC-2 type transport system ATP-binding protein
LNVLVNVDGISFNYGKRPALKEISFTTRGGLVALVGPNGAGKSTLLRLIAGDLDPSVGRVEIGAAEHASARERRQSVVYLPQSPPLHPRMTTHEFVSYCGWLRGMSSRESRSAALAAIEKVRLLDRRSDRVSRLSGGMQRRAALAAAIVSRPPILLLDEPMSGLDPDQRLGVRGLVAELSESTTVLLATHVMQDLPGLTDRIIMLDAGRVRFDGSLSGFTDNGPLTTETLELAFKRHLGGQT